MMTKDELVDVVYEYIRQPKNYERGWDIIVEATERAEVAEMIGNATTVRGALYKVGRYVRSVQI